MANTTWWQRIWPTWPTNEPRQSAVGEPILMSAGNRQATSQQVLASEIAKIIAANNGTVSTESVHDLVAEIRKCPEFTLPRDAIFGMVAAAKMTVSPPSASDEKQVRLAKHLESLWPEHLKKMCESFEFGYACFEKVRGQPHQDMTVVTELVVLDPAKCKVKWSDNRICGVVYSDKDVKPSQEDAGKDAFYTVKEGEITYTSKGTFAIVLNGSQRKPLGESRYRGAPESVLHDLIELKRQKAIFTKKFANGQGVAYGPSTAPDQPGDTVEDKTIDKQTGKPRNPLMELREMIKGWLSGGHLVLPSETDASGKRFYEASIIQPNTQGAQFFNDSKVGLRDEAAASVGVPPLVIYQTSVGSLALAKVQLTVFAQSVLNLARALGNFYQKQIIDEAVTDVYGENSPGQFKLDLKAFEVDLYQMLGELLKVIFPTLVMNGQVDIEPILKEFGMEQLKQIKTPSQAPSPESASVPTPIPADQGQGQEPVKVADTALNGAQIASLLEVMSQLAARSIPPGVADDIINAAFPTIPKERVDSIISQMMNYAPPVQPDQPVAMSANAKPAFGSPAVFAAAGSARKELNAIRDKLAEAIADPENVDGKGVAAAIRAMRETYAKFNTAGRLLGQKDLVNRPESKTPEKVDQSIGQSTEQSASEAN
jgi:hypothetical protein